MSARLETIGRRITEHSGVVLVAAAVVAVVSLFGVARLRADSNVIEFFADDTGIVDVYERILPRLTGPYSLEIVVEAGSSWRDLDTQRTVDRLARDVEALPGVARVISVADFLKKAADSGTGYSLPPTAEALDDAWLSVDRHMADEMRPLVADDGALRLSVIARPMGSAEHRVLVDDIRELLSRPEIAAWRPHLTGVVTLLVALQDELIVSQARSFGAAFLLIVPLVGLFFGSLRYALVSLPPNLVPILATLGAMGAAGIALNPATVMIAAIAFGIVVDDSIHFLSHYRESRLGGLDRQDAAIETLAAVGRPLWITSVVVASGFSVLCFSSFLPLFDFGLLAAATMLGALVGNLVLLPALLTR